MKQKVVLFVGVIVLLIFVVVGYFLLGESKIAVLTYHGVVEQVTDANSVDISVDYFEKQMKWLSKHDYKTITMDEFYTWKQEKKKFPRKTVLITFDDGQKNIYENALPILEKYKLKATVFVVWRYNEDEKTKEFYINKEEINDIRKNHKLLSIESHSYNLHIREKAVAGNYELYNEDMKTVKRLDEKAKYYAYPFGIYNDNYKKALKYNGYKLAFTFGPYAFASKDDDNYIVPRIGVFESTSFTKFKLKLFLQK